MVEMSGGEALVKSLVNEGVDTVFGIPGIQMYGIVAAIRDEPGIRMITTRHEQATTYIDSGYQFNLGYAFPTALGANRGPCPPLRGVHGRRRRVHVQRRRAFHGGPVRHQRNDRRLPERFLRQRRPRSGRYVRRGVGDRSAQPRFREVRRVVRRGRDAGGRPDGPGEAASARAGAAGAGGHRRALRGDADTTRSPDCIRLQYALDTSPGRPNRLLNRRRRVLRAAELLLLPCFEIIPPEE